MGLCGSKDNLTAEERAARDAEAKKNSEVEKALKKAQNEDLQFNKLLLLGAGESGKSTLFKQMISIYGEGFNTETRKGYTNIIHNNVLTAMKTLCEQRPAMHDHYHLDTDLKSQEALDAEKHILEHKLDADFDAKAVHAIKTLWDDGGIRETYEHRAKFQLTDSANYFFDRIDTIGALDYIPTEQDVLRSRVRTTGIVEQSFLIEGNRFKMFDVGGQRNERKKWIHCFQDVTAVLFVAAISEYDMVLFEDESTNRMHEALELFEEISNSQWFRKTAMILFLNKKDLFAEKIVKIPLTVCFPDYPGLNDYDEGVAFIQGEFCKRSKDKSKEIYVHVTTATDKDNMKVVFNAVKDIVVRRSLQEGGLLSY